MSETNEGIFSCKGMCWIVGVLLGFAAFLILRGRMEMGFIIALIIAVVILVATAMALRSIFCGALDVSNGSVSSASTPTEKAPPAAALDTATTATTSAEVATPKPVESEAAPEAPVKEAAPAKAKAPVAKKAAPKKAPSKKAPAKKEVAKKPAAAKAPASKPVAADGKPETLSKARAGGADDLKQIKGVGPKMEAMLNGMGFYHFDQIAGWRKKEVEWVNENLQGFKGRVTRDDWVSQAKVLARGGTTDFAKKVKKGNVY